MNNLLTKCPISSPYQTAGGGQAKRTFDVAAIHTSKPAVSGDGIKPLPNGTGYIVQNMTVKSMMTVIYRIPPGRLQGGPDWFCSPIFLVMILG
jgi:uncharacterized protein (TIGR03435 family)